MRAIVGHSRQQRQGVMSGRSLEARLQAVDALADVDVAEARPQLAKALRAKTALIVGRAAKIAASRYINDLLPDIETALARFFDLPGEKDAGCLAKNALVDACDDLESSNTDLFVRGVHCVQLEPVWGGQEDRAAGIRARSLMALFRLRHHRAILEAARLLADPWPAARAGAARAIANGSPLPGVPLLRYKALIGDENPRVTEQALGALLALDPDESLDFVAGLLASSDETVADMAAMALGESRLESACDPLIARVELLAQDPLPSRSSRPMRVVLVALAVLRRSRATQCLIEMIRHAPSKQAIGAIEALATFSYDRDLANQVRDAARARPKDDRASVLVAYDKAFGQSS